MFLKISWQHPHSVFILVKYLPGLTTSIELEDSPYLITSIKPFQHLFFIHCGHAHCRRRADQTSLWSSASWDQVSTDWSSQI